MIKITQNTVTERAPLKFLRRSASGKHLMRFQSESSFFKLIWRSGVDEVLVWKAVDVSGPRTDLSIPDDQLWYKK